MRRPFGSTTGPELTGEVPHLDVHVPVEEDTEWLDTRK